MNDLDGYHDFFSHVEQGDPGLYPTQYVRVYNAPIYGLTNKRDNTNKVATKSATGQINP